MKKYFIINALLWMTAAYCFAENIKTCEGNVTKIDEYGNGILVIWMNGEECGDKQRFWIDELDGKSREKLMSIIQIAAGTGKTITATVDTDLTLDKFDGRFYRLEINK